MEWAQQFLRMFGGAKVIFRFGVFLMELKKEDRVDGV